MYKNIIISLFILISPFGLCTGQNFPLRVAAASSNCLSSSSIAPLAMGFVVRTNSILLRSLLEEKFLSSTEPFSAVEAREKVVDTMQNVTLLSRDKINHQGVKLGVDYFAQNKNDFRVYVSIKTIQEKNIYEGFVPGDFIIEPGESAYLGWVIQNDRSKDADWEIEWKVDVGEKITKP